MTDLDLSQVRGGFGLNYGQQVHVNGMPGQVISRGLNQTHGATVSGSGLGLGPTHLSGYDLNFRRVLNAATPTFTGIIRNMQDLNRLRSRGF